MRPIQTLILTFVVTLAIGDHLAHAQNDGVFEPAAYAEPNEVVARPAHAWQEANDEVAHVVGQQNDLLDLQDGFDLPQEGVETLQTVSPDGSISVYTRDRVVPTIIIPGVNCPADFQPEQCQTHAEDTLVLRDTATGALIREINLFTDTYYDYSIVNHVEFSASGEYIGVHYSNTEAHVAYQDHYLVISSNGDSIVDYATLFDLGPRFTATDFTDGSVRITYQADNIENHHTFPRPERVETTEIFVFGAVNGRVIAKSEDGFHRVIVSKRIVEGAFPHNPTLLAMEETIVIRVHDQNLHFIPLDPYAIDHADPPAYVDRTAGAFFTPDQQHFAVRIARFSGPTRLNQYLIFNLNGNQVFDLNYMLNGSARIENLEFTNESVTISLRREIPADFSAGRYYSGVETSVITIQKNFTQIFPPNGPGTGDVNWDGHVDRQDLAVLVRNFGLRAGGLWEAGDLDGDGKIGLKDISLLQRNFDPAPTAQLAAAPQAAAAPPALQATRRRPSEDDEAPLRLRRARS